MEPLFGPDKSQISALLSVTSSTHFTTTGAAVIPSKEALLYWTEYSNELGIVNGSFAFWSAGSVFSIYVWSCSRRSASNSLYSGHSPAILNLGARVGYNSPWVMAHRLSSPFPTKVQMAEIG